MYSKSRVATEKIQQQEVASSLEGLDFFLDSFDACFHICIEQGDRGCFRFCMRRLFVSIDTLYLIMLPDLLATAAQKEASPQMRYQVWSCLRDLKRLIEHIEPLCQLLNGLAMTMLEALDLYADQASDNATTWKPEAAIDRAHADLLCRDEREKAFTALTECLNDWRQCHNRCLPFATQFAELYLLVPSLARTDSALDALLDYAGSLFGEVLPEFYTISSAQEEPCERIAIRLLDMMQKVDLILVQTCVLLDILYTLLQCYTSDSATHSQPEEKSLNSTITASKPFS